MAIFNSYVCLPEGNHPISSVSIHLIHDLLMNHFQWVWRKNNRIFMAFFDHQTRGFPADFYSSTSGIRSIAIKFEVVWSSMNQAIRREKSCRFSLSLVLSESWDLTFFPISQIIPAVPWGVIICDNFMGISRKTPSATRHLPHRRSRQSLGRPGGPVDQGVPGAVWELDAVWPSSFSSQFFWSFCRVECGKSARHQKNGWFLHPEMAAVFIKGLPHFCPKISRNSQRVDILEKHQFDGPKSGLAPSQ